MIYGTGIDLVEIPRMAKLSEKTAFVDRVFSNEEKAYAHRGKSVAREAEILAGNFAVKEAFSKALGTGIRNINFKDIVVLRDELGKPYIKINEKINDILLEKCIDNISVSISHTLDVAAAICILERKQL